MRPVFNSAQARRADEIMQVEYGYLGILLMETAGRRAAQLIRKFYPDYNRFVVVAGGGSNGGDGLVIARYLRRYGKELFILLTKPPEKLTALSRIQYDILTRFGLTCHLLSPDSLRRLQAFCDQEPRPILIDALVGVGLQQGLREPIVSLVEFLRSLNLKVVGIDLPSGLSADTGALFTPPLQCEHTIAFQTAKICHLVTPAALYCGQLHVVDIGMYPEVIERIGSRCFWVREKSVARFFPRRPAEAHKGTFGHALLVGGSKGKGGAIALATIAALRAGAGLATALIPGTVAPSFQRKALSGMSLPYGDEHVHYLNEVAALWALPFLKGKTAIGIGPGMGNSPETVNFLREFLPRLQVPCILDADALNILSQHEALWEKVPPNSIITPHPAEAARLLGISTEQVQARRLESALRLAQKRRVYVLLKGANPILATPQGESYLFQLMEPALATAGTGDVLTGLITGLLAQEVAPRQAALLAISIQGKAARIALRRNHTASLTAALLLGHIGAAMKEIQESPS
ncbi:MAG: NAD(P)H-hydrate dehydratase [Bacteroidia bacterium]|nr:NAD(P)H-hydrate dehydratase [Bacteroidia bacterium]MDW8133505.1 NAD(P)H-hydrate dehydratase [Bacteroidia bacterium]